MGVCAARQRQSVRPASPNDLPEAANDEHAAPSFSQCGQILRHSRVGTPRPAPPALRVCGDRPRRRPGARSSLFFGFKAPRARGALTRLRARECALRLLLAPHGACCLLPPPLNLRVCLTWWRCWLRPSEAVLLPRPSGAGPSAGRRAVAVVAVPTRPLTIVTLALHRASPDTPRHSCQPRGGQQP